jgi:hypothetical protein
MSLPSRQRASRIRVMYRAADGAAVDTTLDRVAAEDVVAGLPVREFRWYKGRRHYSSWYWCGTGQRPVLRRGLSSSRTADSSVTLQRAERWRPRQSVQDPAP